MDFDWPLPHLISSNVQDEDRTQDDRQAQHCAQDFFQPRSHSQDDRLEPGHTQDNNLKKGGKLWQLSPADGRAENSWGSHQHEASTDPTKTDPTKLLVQT